MSAIRIDGHNGIWELLLDLPGLIANVVHRGLLRGQVKTATFPLVSAAEHGHAMVGQKETQQHLGVGRLACAANGDVTNAYDRKVERRLFQDAGIETGITHTYAQLIKP